MARSGTTPFSGAPQVPRHYLPRSRLLERIPLDAPFVVIDAPAGTGKTVLLAQWAAMVQAHPGSAGAVGLWVTAGRDNAARRPFWVSLANGLAETAVVHPGMIMATASHAIPATEDLASLLRRAFTELDRDVMIVVDDAHLLEPEPAADLLALVDAVPRVRVIAAGSGLTVPGGRVVSPIAPDDLRFDEAETAALLGSGGVDPLAVHRATGGHPLSVRAVALAGTTHASSPRSIPDAVRSLGDDVFRVAIRSSVTDEVSVSLASDLSGEEDAERMLRVAEQNGLGLWSSGIGGEVFRFTSTVRTALEDHLRAEHPDDVTGLVRIVARWAHENARPMAALRGAVESQDYELVDAVLRTWWVDLLDSHGKAVVQTLGSVKRATLRRHPLMTVLLGIAYNSDGAHRVKAVEMFGLAIVSARLRRDGDGPLDRALMRAIESTALRVIGRPHQAGVAARDASALLDLLSEDEKASAGTLLPQLYTHVGISLLNAGDTALALDRFERGVAAADAVQSVWALHPLALTAGARALLGDMPQTRAAIAQLRSREWPEGWKDGYRGALYRVAEALDALERGEPDEADTVLRTMDRHLPTIEHWADIATAQAAADLFSGQAERGIERLRQTIRWHVGRPGVTDARPYRVNHAEAMLHLALGHPSAAITAVRSGRPHPMTALDLARVSLSTGDAAAAMRHLSMAPTTGYSSRMLANRAVLEVALMLRLGAVDDASRALGSMIAMLREHGLRTPLMLIPEKDYREIVALTRKVMPDAIPAVLEDVPIPHPIKALRSVPELSERELVVLRALEDHPRVSDIASALYVSGNTVKSHLRTIYRKLGVSTREDALMAARVLRLLDVRPDHGDDPDPADAPPSSGRRRSVQGAKRATNRAGNAPRG